MAIVWTSQLDLGIEVIDKQHRRIADYINQLEISGHKAHPREEIKRLIFDLVDYTVSHFGFEESLQEEAGYPFIKAHQKVHGLFNRRISDFLVRFEQGEDITIDLHNLLVTWLLNHIRHDDADYVESVKAHLRDRHDFVDKKKGLLARLFG